MRILSRATPEPSAPGLRTDSCYDRSAAASGVSRDSDARGLLLEVLAQHRHLALVVRAQAGAVEPLGRRRHPLETELADRLAVLDHEGDVAGPDLERGAAAVAPSLRVVAEPRVEEARVVGSQLAGGRVVGHHLGGDLRRDAYPLRG